MEIDGTYNRNARIQIWKTSSLIFFEDIPKLWPLPVLFFSCMKLVDRPFSIAPRHHPSPIHSSLLALSVTLCLFILKIKFSEARINYASRNYKTSAEYSSALSPLRSSIACTQIPSPSTACFRTLLFLPVNPTKEIRVAISISNVCRFQWESWITWSCNLLIAHDGFSKENSSRSIHNSINYLWLGEWCQK